MEDEETEAFSGELQVSYGSFGGAIQLLLLHPLDILLQFEETA